MTYKETIMAGWFEVATNDEGEFNFVLKAGNNEVILRSQQYASKASALAGIASIQANSSIDERYERLAAKDKRPYFNLKAANGQVIGTSQMYASAGSRDAGIESVKVNGVSEDIRGAA